MRHVTLHSRHGIRAADDNLTELKSTMRQVCIFISAKVMLRSARVLRIMATSHRFFADADLIMVSLTTCDVIVNTVSINDVTRGTEG